MTTQRARRLALPGLLVVLLLVLGGCGGDDDGAAAPSVDDTTAGASGGSDESVDDVEASAEDDDVENPWVVGYRVTAPTGTQVEVDTAAVAQGEEQSPFTQVISGGDEPSELLFTNWVESATLTITLLDGESATIEGITGRFVDPENPFGGVEVSEVHDSVEVSGDDTVTLDIP